MDKWIQNCGEPVRVTWKWEIHIDASNAPALHIWAAGVLSRFRFLENCTQMKLRSTPWLYNTDRGVAFAVQLITSAWTECTQTNALESIQVALPASVFGNEPGWSFLLWISVDKGLPGRRNENECGSMVSFFFDVQRVVLSIGTLQAPQIKEKEYVDWLEVT